MAGSERTNGGVSPKAGELPPEEIIFGRSPVVADLRRRAGKVSQTRVPVLLCGDAGTGKETVARWIHAHSSSGSGQFVKVNCAAIPGTLLESEVFGYERGAFTGAHTSKPGRVELAHQGTLFLDEIADSETALQSKLLHFLQDGRFSRIGDEMERCVDARIICSTNKDLADEVEAGRFRADLFYRISVVELHLPRLIERREDIPEIAEYLRTLYEKQFARQSEPFSAETLNYLQSLSWPGNMRELANSVARYVLVGPETGAWGLEQLPRRSEKWPQAAGTGKTVPLKHIASEAIREMERRVILEALHANQWNRRKTAEALRISYRALMYKIRDAGLASHRTVSRGPGQEPPVRPPAASTD